MSKYYFFGFIKRKWEFNKVDRIKVSSFYSDFGQNNDVSNYDDTGTGVGCLLSIILFFIPSKITNKEFKIESLNDKNTAIKSVKITIDNQEFNFIKDYYNGTINYKKYITQLKSNISNLSYKSHLKFAVLICKKLYFDYQKFVEVYNWGDANLLMDAILICEQAIKNTADINQVNAFLPKIDLIAPQMDDFGSKLGSYALNASASVYETLQFITDKDGTHIYSIATHYTDTIDFKIQEENELTELEIENHPLMIEAWNFILEQTKC